MTERESELSSLLSSASLVLVGSLLGAMSQLVERVIIGRMLSVDAYGEVSIGLAVMTFTVTLSLIGFTHGVPRYVSRFDDERDVRGVWVTGLALTGAVAVALALSMYLSLDLFGGLFFDEPSSARLVVPFMLAVPFVVGFKVAVGTIRGFENTIYRTYVRDLTYPITRIALLVVLLSLGWGVLAAGYAYLAGAVAAFVLAHVLLNRLLPLVGSFRTHAKEMVTFSAPLVISTVISILLTQTDTLMLGYFRPSQQVGLYNAAYPLANGMLVVLSAFGFLYLPLASRLDADDEREEIDTIYKITTKWIFIVTFPAFLTFVVFPSDVLSIFFGERYAPAGLALAILSVGFFTNAAGGRNRETLSALGYTVAILIANLLAFLLNVGLNLLLIPAYGFIGAAVTSAASYIALNITVYVVLRVKFGISPFSRWSTRTFTLLPLLTIPPAFVLSQWVSLSAVTLPVFLVLGGIVSVAVVSVTGCLQPEDKVALEFVEDAIGIRVPFVRRYLPEAYDQSPNAQRL